MPRHLFFAIALIGVVGVFLNAPAEAGMAAALCENQFTNCIGRCANPGSGVNDNRCMWYCDRQVKKCLIRVHGTVPRHISKVPNQKSSTAWVMFGEPRPTPDEALVRRLWADMFGEGT